MFKSTISVADEDSAILQPESSYILNHANLVMVQNHIKQTKVMRHRKDIDCIVEIREALLASPACQRNRASRAGYNILHLHLV